MKILGAASVARAWSGYVDSLVDGKISGFTKFIFGEFYEGYFSKHPDLLSFFICILYSIVLGKVKTKDDNLLVAYR